MISSCRSIWYRIHSFLMILASCRILHTSALLLLRYYLASNLCMYIAWLKLINGSQKIYTVGRISTHAWVLYQNIFLKSSNKSIHVEKEGEYRTSLWACVTTLYAGHDLCNDFHKLESSGVAICGYVAKPHVLCSINAGCCSCYVVT